MPNFAHLFIPCHSSHLSYFKDTAASNSFRWELFAVIRLSWNFIKWLSMSSWLWIYLFLFFYDRTYSRKIIDSFLKSVHSCSSWFQHLIRWSLALQLNTTTTSVGDAPPVSVCSMPCPAGQHGVITQPSCCFFCEECLENERTILSEYLPRCETCPTARNFTWPDETRTMCLPIPPTFLQVTRLEGAVLLVFDILVFALTCATIYFYIKNGSKLDMLIQAYSVDA